MDINYDASYTKNLKIAIYSAHFAEIKFNFNNSYFRQKMSNFGLNFNDNVRFEI